MNANASLQPYLFDLQSKSKQPTSPLVPFVTGALPMELSPAYLSLQSWPGELLHLPAYLARCICWRMCTRCTLRLCCRYKLTKPAGVYAQFQQQLQQRLDLCTTAVKLLKDNSSLTPLAAAEAAYNEANSDCDPDEEQEPIVSFAQAQVSAWMEV